MELVLTRYEYGPDYTLGILKAGPHTFQTLELAWRANKRNVSAIPNGVYPVTPNTSSASPKFDVHGVINRTAIQIHIGNAVTDIKGCILLGMDLNRSDFHPPRVLNSRDALHTLASYLHGMIQATLIVKDIHGGSYAGPI